MQSANIINSRMNKATTTTTQKLRNMLITSTMGSARIESIN